MSQSSIVNNSTFLESSQIDMDNIQELMNRLENWRKQGFKIVTQLEVVDNGKLKNKGH